MDEQKSEQSEFLKDLEIPTENVLEAPLEVEPEKETEERPQLVNRKIRRQLERGEKYREEALLLGERLKVMTELGKFKEETGEDKLKEIDLIYGTDTPEHIAAGNILKKALQGREDAAVERALEKLREERSQESVQQEVEEKNLDEMLEQVEDEHGIDMSDATNRRAFLTLLERASAKDADGDIKEYADPDFVAEQFLARRDQSNGRAKELASRSMVRGGQTSSTVEQTAIERYLKDNDII